VWKGPGDAYAGAYTEVSGSAVSDWFGAMAANSDITLGSAITWGTANPVSANDVVYTKTFGYWATAGAIGGAAGVDAAAMCAAVCTAKAPWNMDAVSYLPIVQATTAMTSTECTGF